MGLFGGLFGIYYVWFIQYVLWSFWSNRRKTARNVPIFSLFFNKGAFFNYTNIKLTIYRNSFVKNKFFKIVEVLIVAGMMIFFLLLIFT
jgi:hypothetical protein